MRIAARRRDKLTLHHVQTRTAVPDACPYTRTMQTDFVKADVMAGTSDERWAAWVAKGVEHDRNIKNRVIAIAAGVAAAAALSLVIFLLR